MFAALAALVAYGITQKYSTANADNKVDTTTKGVIDATKKSHTYVPRFTPDYNRWAFLDTVQRDMVANRSRIPRGYTRPIKPRRDWEARVKFDRTQLRPEEIERMLHWENQTDFVQVGPYTQHKKDWLATGSAPVSSDRYVTYNRLQRGWQAGVTRIDRTHSRVYKDGGMDTGFMDSDDVNHRHVQRFGNS